MVLEFVWFCLTPRGWLAKIANWEIWSLSWPAGHGGDRWQS
jgi:hypothetical protein